METDSHFPSLADLKSPAILLATWFGSGLLPRAPGTWGSLFALPFAWAILTVFGGVGLALAAAALFAIGIPCANAFIRRAMTEDPAPVVIDEVVGIWLVLSLAAPSLTAFTLGFILFRLFDVLKPWPVSWADRTLKGGLGVMLDDVLAAGYAGGVLYVVSPWLEAG